MERPAFDEALGRTIQVLRTDLGLDRKDLADLAGISYSYLAAIENGKKAPSSKVLHALSDALGLRSHELLAAAETRIERGATLPPVSETPAGRWFHAERAAPAPAAREAGDLVLHHREQAAAHRNVPRSPTGYLMALERATTDLTDEDRELVLELAHNLARRRLRTARVEPARPGNATTGAGREP